MNLKVFKLQIIAMNNLLSLLISRIMYLYLIVLILNFNVNLITNAYF